MTREEAIKKIIGSGGTWPPDLTPAPAWKSTGRWAALPPRWKPYVQS